MYRYILFDLDGTLTNTFEGISKSIIYALEDFNIQVENIDELRCFIGPPLFDQFKEFCSFNDQQAEQAVKKYRERYSATGWKECEIIDGAASLLQKLRKAGKILAVATSKPECFAVSILKQLGIHDYFDFIGGAELEHSGRNSKTDIINYVLKSLNVTDRTEAVIVGDRFHDIEGAKAAGIGSVGVLCGFGSREELLAYGADHIAESMEQAAKFLL